MSQKSRTKNALLNCRIDSIFYIITLLLSFFSRKFFLDKLGANFIGLIGTTQNILSFLNLVELGIGSAIGFVLYKPIFENNTQQLNEIISLLGYLYQKIGKMILVLGLICSIAIPFVFSSAGITLPIIYFSYYSFLSTTLIGYFYNYKQVLLSADQKNYQITLCFQSTNIIKIILQIILLEYTSNYYIWVGLELLFGILYSWLLNQRIKKIYPWLKIDKKPESIFIHQYPEIKRYTKQIFIHKTTYLIQYQTTPILIYAFSSLKTVAYFGNYTLVTDKISALINVLLGSTSASVGNLIAEGNPSKIITTFWELTAFRFYVSGIITYSTTILLEPFISLWLGKTYLLPSAILTLLMIRLFIQLNRGTIDQYLYGYGLFHDIWAPITESTLFIIIAIIGGYHYGINGILLGGIISLFTIICCWKPYFLFTRGFKLKATHYFMNWLKFLLVFIISAFISKELMILTVPLRPEVSYFNWISYGMITTSMFSIIFLLLLYPLSKGIRHFIQRIY